MKRRLIAILWKIGWMMSIPLFMVSLAMAARTASIHTNDLFHFGRGRQWWCYAIVNYWHLSASVEVYEPSYVSGWVGVPPGKWFFFHVAAGGGIWSITGAPTVETGHRDFGVAGFATYGFGGTPAKTTYWIDLGPILAICTLLSGGVLALKFYHVMQIRDRQRMGKCPKCSYDLRAHKPREKCPECGTVIAAETPTITPALSTTTLESVKIDLMGEMHLDFDETGLRMVSQGYARLRLPAKWKGHSVVWNRRIAYQDVNWIGVIRRRQWEMLIPAIPFVPLGMFWSAISVGDWGPMVFSLVVLLLLGILPLTVFLRGRIFLGIASTTEVVMLPLDKHKNALRRILGLLRQSVPQSVQWHLEGTAFSDMEAWDNRPPTGKAFNQKRYALISVLLGLWGTSNLLANLPRYRTLGAILATGVLCFTLVWIIRAATGKFRHR